MYEIVAKAPYCRAREADAGEVMAIGRYPDLQVDWGWISRGTVVYV